ncbi:MAG: hypothetical protein QM704_02810 [Anaeromyxobacteraceae bacterium]
MNPDPSAPRAAVPTAGDLLSDPAHGGPLDGPHVLGEARAGDRFVRVGLWLDGRGWVARARFQATVCASLVAYAEAACRALEAGVTDLGPAALQARVRGIHPAHRDRAAIVAAAVLDALSRVTRPTPAQEPA